MLHAKFASGNMVSYALVVVTVMIVPIYKLTGLGKIPTLIQIRTT